MSYKYTYYTCLTNNIDSKSSDGTVEPNLQFNESRENPIITNTKDYEVCITSFKLDTKTLPSFIPIIKYVESSAPTTDQKLETIYEVTYSVVKNTETYSYTQPIHFKQQDETVSVPDFIKGYANYESGYYNLYNFENFFTTINVALRNCLKGLRTVYDIYFGTGSFDTAYVLSGTWTQFAIPYFIFDKDSRMAYINAPVINFNPSTPKLSLYLNTPLYRLFDSLPFQLNNYTFNTLLSNEKITKTVKLYKMNFNNFEGSNIVSIYPKIITTTVDTIPVKIDHYVIYQDYETLSSWSPVESIVITSSTLPISPCIVSQNHSYVNGIETTEGSMNITEMELSDFRGADVKPGIIYNPTNFRWVNLLDMHELKTINFQVIYRLKINGQLIPFKISSGENFSLKLCFRKLK